MSLPVLDSLQTTVKGISLYAILPASECARNYDMGYRGPPPSPNDLLISPHNMNVHCAEVVRISSLAQDVCQLLNKMVTEQENMYIKPPNHNGPGRYETRFRRHGRTFTVLDTYAERGIQVPVDNSKPTSKISVWENTIKDMLRICQTLEDPVNMLILPNQMMKPFRDYPARYPEYVIISDHREIAEREGDDSPYYWMRIEWLLHDFNAAHFVNWSSMIYNRIRSELYLALPTLMDDANIHGDSQIPGNRFSISMGEPNVWYIEDKVLKKTYYLWSI
ncbi:hypothetical protein M407DRAFT_28687 [Tulasnella calospora MUT 4182]|uniref:Uncharacterized protein n=1 Tax=Tulasnella calospora MUT 4182 TaxID=1051891 RepID=A0A0C3QAB2_9AGAM|nr:hypothetical protein M407DRAFT_28687 [Tulasnella calospora MUT 4182]